MPAWRREGRGHRHQSSLWQDPRWSHGASSYHGPDCEPGRENTPRPQKGLYPPLGAMAISVACAPPRGLAVGTCSPHAPRGHCGMLLSLDEHLCPKVALKRSFLLRGGGGLCYHISVTKPGREKGGSASPPPSWV